VIVVVKIGSSSITDERGEVSAPAIDKLCAEVAGLRSQGHRVVLVTSGAIAAGLPILGLFGVSPTELATLQAIAAVGQSRLMRFYDDTMGRHGLVSGQVLLARSEFSHPDQINVAKTTLLSLLNLGVVPVVNENDAVANDEIRFGDNDILSALVANLLNADLLVMLTDTPGLLSADPRLHQHGTLIEEIVEIDEEISRVQPGSGSARGSGGMLTKLVAARAATWSGVRVVIAAADRPGVLAGAVNGLAGIGTVVRPRDQRLSARKLRIAFALRKEGRIVVDDGARAALVERQASLLPVGIVDVVGKFGPEAGVDICDRDGNIFAKGMVRAAATDLRAAMGLRTADLPPHMPHEVVHRDDLVVTGS
jgi:glutamate 5-kinase